MLGMKRFAFPKRLVVVNFSFLTKLTLKLFKVYKISDWFFENINYKRCGKDKKLSSFFGKQMEILCAAHFIQCRLGNFKQKCMASKQHIAPVQRNWIYLSSIN